MFLVAVAIGFMVAGTVIGRELTEGTARICSFVGLGMLIVTWFVDACATARSASAGSAAWRWPSASASARSSTT